MCFQKELLDINIYEKELQCVYKNETYTVRDNGAVFRHPKTKSRVRSYDNKWTFGKLDTKTGYLKYSSARMHRIVATAFHKEAPSKEHVADHIDTNRQNNRPENLRWVTKFENILLNPITVKRIELSCGSLEAFLENPSILQSNVDPNFTWMRRVTIAEAEIAKERLLEWASSDSKHSGGKLGEWIFTRKRVTTQHIENLPLELSSSSLNDNYLDMIDTKSKTLQHIEDLPLELSPSSHNDSFLNMTPDTMSKTFGATQRNWRVPCEFPCCPLESVAEPLLMYKVNLLHGNVFSDAGMYSSSVDHVVLSDDAQALYVLGKSTSSTKPWTLACITYENNLYVHTSLGTFFKQKGAKKELAFELGLEWTGGDGIDDYC